MQTKANLQDLFLLRARRDKLPVTMFLMNGFQMRGTITGFDAFVVVLDSDGDEIDVKRVNSTRYTFEMPRGAVTVEASFARETLCLSVIGRMTEPTVRQLK